MRALVASAEPFGTSSMTDPKLVAAHTPSSTPCACSLQASRTPATASFITQALPTKKTKRGDEVRSPPGKRSRNSEGDDSSGGEGSETDLAGLAGLLPVAQQPEHASLEADEDSLEEGGTVFSPSFAQQQQGVAYGLPVSQGLLHLHPGQQQQQYADPAQHSGQACSGSEEPVLRCVAALPHHQDGSLQHHQVPEAVEHVVPANATVEEVEDEEEETYIDFDPLLFIKSLPPLEQVIPKHRPVILPRKTRTCPMKTLVLDLDETLVHSSLEVVPCPDFTFPVHFNNQEHLIHVKQRPHLHTFMERVAELFEVVVFTASQRIYAEKLLNIIDPTRRLIKHRIFRDSCVIVDGNYLKDLTVLGRDLRTTLIIDNSPQAFGFQVDNGVPIESWYDDDSDQELLRVLPFLESLVDLEDVRPAIQQRFRMRELIERAC